MKPASSIFFTRSRTVFSSKPSFFAIPAGLRCRSANAREPIALNASSQKIRTSLASIRRPEPDGDLKAKRPSGRRRRPSPVASRQKDPIVGFGSRAPGRKISVVGHARVMATTANVQNGVNVDQLVGTIEAVKGTPGLAKFKFRSTSRWDGGARGHTTIKSFFGVGQEDTTRKVAYVLEGDEPPVLLGTNNAPNGVETVLAALSKCMTVSF